MRSVPGELNSDKNEALRLAQGAGHISKQQLAEVRLSHLYPCHVATSGRRAHQPEPSEASVPRSFAVDLPGAPPSAGWPA